MDERKTALSKRQGSDKLCPTEVPYRESPRDWFLKHAEQTTSPPMIAYSDFIPKEYVELLMRHKKDSALGVKYEDRVRKPDAITNMEGALHTFVTAVAPALMFGIHAWEQMHTVRRFGTDDKGNQLAMRCILSAMIHQDFEYSSVMAKAFACSSRMLSQSNSSFPPMISIEDKRDPAKRAAYDQQIKCALVWHLRASRQLPSREGVVDKCKTQTPAEMEQAPWEICQTIGEAAELLQRDIVVGKWHDGPGYHRTMNVFIEHRHHLISMEMLINTASHQIHNEFMAIDAICKDHTGGWIYTFNPPAIFAQWWNSKPSVNNNTTTDRHISGTEFMSLVWLTALRRRVRAREHDQSASGTGLGSGFRAIAWDDYSTPGILECFDSEGSPGKAWIKAMPLSSIYDKTKPPAKGISCALPSLAPFPENRFFIVPEGCEGALLVLHNNSDAFGQNIETEGESGSLDGAIGANSSLAASLMRQRPDLLDNLIKTKPFVHGMREALLRPTF